MPITASKFNSLKPLSRLLGWLSVLIACFATNAFAGQVNLGWDASTGPVAGYRVYYGTASGNYTSQIDAGAATTATVASLADGATYYFAVKAYDSVGNESGFSNEVNQTLAGTTPTTPTTVAPVSSFSATPTSGVAPLLVTLTDTSTGTIANRVWDFGDGTTSTSQNAMKTYNVAGVYTVKLTVDNAGGKSTTSKTITVTSAVPTANFTATPTSGTVPLTVQVADSSTNATGWNWNFGDGTTSNLQIPPAHVYKTAGNYTVSLTVSGPGGTSTAKTTSITAKAAATGTLPSPWVDKDIGNVAIAGSAGYSNGTYTLQGSGADIWGTADGFNFAYQPLNGDGTIVARVANLTNTNSWAKAGVMIRESLDANSRHAMVVLTPNNGVAFQYRATVGGSSSNINVNGLAPYWVKLTRAGTTFTAYQSANGSTWTKVGSVTMNLSANTYVGLAVTSHNTAAIANATFDNVSLSVGGIGTGALPSPWLNTDVGTVALTGSAGYSNGTYTLKGAGADIWGTADGFNFAYQPLNGDGTIVARVANLTNTNSWAKAGVMIRESLDANSRHAMVVLTPNNGVAFQYRATVGGSSSNINVNGLAPYWVKLTRAGTTFTAYQSANGSTWTKVGSVTMSLAANTYVGLAVTSHNNTVLATASFDNVAFK
jgi:PKD repeat protein